MIETVKIIETILLEEYHEEILNLNKDQQNLTLDFKTISKTNIELAEKILDETEKTINDLRKIIKTINEEYKGQIRITIKNLPEEEEERINFIGQIREHTDETIPALMTALASKNKRKASELIVTNILSTEHIYSTMDDDKSEMYIYQNGIYLPNAKSFIKLFCRRILNKTYTTTICNEVISKIEADTFIDKELLFKNEDTNRIPVENGILNLKLKILEPFTHKKRYFNKIPIKYDPEKDCPNIKQHFKTILKNSDTETLVIQELFGYLLLKNAKFEKSFMFSGNGRNGKSKSLEIMKRFLGAENCSNITLQQLEKDQFILGEFHNKLANLGGDLSNTPLKETGNFKSLIGRDLITAPRKFLTPINFVNYSKMIFCANEIPKTYDNSIAFFNRWIIIDFPYTFLQQKEYDLLKEKDKTNVKLADPNIIDKISSNKELSGLLNWGLEGLKRLEKQDGFSYSATTDDVKNKWIRKSDSFAAFLMDMVKEDYEGFVLKEDMSKYYSHYCRKHKIIMSGDKHIKKLLIENLGAWEDRESSGELRRTIWKGISFIPNISF